MENRSSSFCTSPKKTIQAQAKTAYANLSKISYANMTNMLTMLRDLESTRVSLINEMAIAGIFSPTAESGKIIIPSVLYNTMDTIIANSAFEFSAFADALEKVLNTPLDAVGSYCNKNSVIGCTDPSAIYPYTIASACCALLSAGELALVLYYEVKPLSAWEPYLSAHACYNTLAQYPVCFPGENSVIFLLNNILRINSASEFSEVLSLLETLSND